MSTLKVTNVKHETSGLNTLVFDNGGTSGGNGRVTTKGTIGEVSDLGNQLRIYLVCKDRIQNSIYNHN